MSTSGAILLFVAVTARAGPTLLLDDVLSSSLAHFPRIQSAVEELLVREGRLTAALGAFDLALEQNSLVWADGYYDGVSVDNRLVKPLPWGGAKTFAGYRVTNDDFPIYQQELVTNDGGELNFGFVLSLWRDREIDDRRFALESARRGVTEATIDLKLARLTTQRNAARAYWGWLTAGQRVAVFRRLTRLAEGRMNGLERRAKAGDIADITVIENRQNLLRRQALLTNAERDLRIGAIELSIYLRDANGEPRQPGEVELPAIFPTSSFSVDDADVMVDMVLARRPELAQLDNRIDLERQRLELAENALKPRIDLGLKAGHDLGAGSRTRDGFEAIVDLQLSIPLERRFGRGRVSSARAQLRQLEIDRGLVEDRLRNELLKLGVTINAAYEFVDITTREARAAERLEQAERKRFAAGESDFFLVNLREERSADASLRNLDARLRFSRNLTDLHALTLNFEALGL